MQRRSFLAAVPASAAVAVVPALTFANVATPPATAPFSRIRQIATFESEILNMCVFQDKIVVATRDGVFLLEVEA